VAAQRKSDPKQLSKLFRGELDWIAMKALEKDRTRRYESASTFAADVQRLLDDEPVEASSPSAGYRFRKFARKHKTALTTVALLAVSLVVGVGASTWQTIRATRAESQARAKETQALAATAAETAARLAEAVQRQRAEAGEREAKERLLDVDRQRQRASINFREAYWAIEDLLYVFDPDRSRGPLSFEAVRQWQTETALHFLVPFSEQRSDDPEVRLQRGVACVHIARVYQVLLEREKAEQSLHQAIAIFSLLVQDFPGNPTFPRELATAHSILADSYYQERRFSTANDSWREAVKVWRDAVRSHPADHATQAQLAKALCTWFDPRLHEPAIAVGLAQRAVELAPHHGETWLALGVASYRIGEWSAAVESLEKALLIAQAVSEGPDRALRGSALRIQHEVQGLFFLAMAQWRRRNTKDAVEAYQQAVRKMESNFRARDLRNRAARAEAAALLGVKDESISK
jgi:tetratricopeptide (TPR) repeat protein